MPVPPSSPHFLNHYETGEDEFFNAGFGTGFALTPPTDRICDLHAGHRWQERSQGGSVHHGRDLLRPPSAGQAVGVAGRIQRSRGGDRGLGLPLKPLGDGSDPEVVLRDCAE